MYACNAPEISVEIAEVRRNKGDGWIQKYAELSQKGSCIGDPGSDIKVLSETSVPTSQGSYDVAEIQSIDAPGKHLYVLKRNIVPISAAEIQEAKERACGTGPNGEVDQWITEKDGTLKLKRFMVTSRCVNGQMREFTKRLN